LRAISLFSGGLDSALAIKVAQDQGIEVIALYVRLGFDSNPNKESQLKKLADELGVEFVIADAVDEYIKNILFSPKYGYGKNFNPCIDCHAFMIKKAYEYLPKLNAKFIISGEVVGQRPMSQRIPAINAINKLANPNDLVVRVLSAKLLPPTLPEKEGWIDREKLLNISGRERKVQLELAKKYNLQNVESPAGGCLLTDINFAKRLKDYHSLLELTPNEIPLLKAGRHFNINGTKVIISRNKDESDTFKNYKGSIFTKMHLLSKPGPIGYTSDVKDPNLLADIMVSYSKFDKAEVQIGNNTFTGTKRDKKEFAKYLV